MSKLQQLHTDRNIAADTSGKRIEMFNNGTELSVLVFLGNGVRRLKYKSNLSSFDRCPRNSSKRDGQLLLYE